MCSEGNQAVALKHPINLKTMANLSPDYDNSELLDQELTIEDLSDVSGGRRAPASYERRCYYYFEGYLRNRLLQQGRGVGCPI